MVPKCHIQTEGKILVFPWLLGWMKARYYDINPLGDRLSARVTDRILHTLTGLDYLQITLPEVVEVRQRSAENRNSMRAFFYSHSEHTFKTFDTSDPLELLVCGPLLMQDHSCQSQFYIGTDREHCSPVPIPGWDPITKEIQPSESAVKSFLNAYSGCRMEFVKMRVPEKRNTIVP